MRGRPKGQIAMEAIIILLLLLVVYTTLVYPLHQMSYDSIDDVRELYLSDQAVRSVVNGVNLVGMSGYGGQTTLKIHVPGNTTFNCSSNGEVRIELNLTNGSITATGGIQMGLTYKKKCEAEPLPPALEPICHVKVIGKSDFGIAYKDGAINNPCDKDIMWAASENGSTIYFCFKNLGADGVNISVGSTPDCSGLG